MGALCCLRQRSASGCCSEPAHSCPVFLSPVSRFQLCLRQDRFHDGAEGEVTERFSGGFDSAQALLTPLAAPTFARPPVGHRQTASRQEWCSCGRSTTVPFPQGNAVAHRRFEPDGGRLPQRSTRGRQTIGSARRRSLHKEDGNCEIHFCPSAPKCDARGRAWSCGSDKDHGVAYGRAADRNTPDNAVHVPWRSGFAGEASRGPDAYGILQSFLPGRGVSVRCRCRSRP